VRVSAPSLAEWTRDIETRRALDSIEALRYE
jgi:hypothetical protein